MIPILPLRSLLALALLGLSLPLACRAADPEVGACCKSEACAASTNGTDGAALFKEKWGIEITSVRLSARGNMIDFRYKVLDPDKAAPLAKVETKPYLIDQATGKKLLVPTTPKLGPLRQSAVKLEAGRIYFMMFANSRAALRAGSKVTVVAGDCQLKDLTLE